MKYLRWLRAVLIEGRDVRLWAEVESAHLAEVDQETVSASTVIAVDPGADRVGLHLAAETHPGYGPASPLPDRAPPLAPCATGVPDALAAMYGGMAELPSIAREYGDPE